MEPSALVTEFDFKGNRLTVVTIAGRPACIAGEVSTALGYADETRLARKINGEWSQEFISGTDFEVITNGRLAALKARLQPVPGSSPPIAANAPSVTVLYESGLHLAAIKARTKFGRDFRRWLATEVLPQLARTGRYAPALPAPQAPDGSARELLAARMGVRFEELPPAFGARLTPWGDIMVRAAPSSTLVELETAALLALAHFGRSPFAPLRFGDLHGWPRLCQATREVFPRTPAAGLAALARWPVPGGVLPTPHLVSTLAPAALAHTPIS